MKMKLTTLEESELRKWLDDAQGDLFPKIKGSAFALAICDEPDPMMCLQMGAMVMFDKPIIAVVPPGMKVPANVKRVACAIIEGDMKTAATQEELRRAIFAVMENDTRVRQ